MCVYIYICICRSHGSIFRCVHWNCIGGQGYAASHGGSRCPVLFVRGQGAETGSVCSRKNCAVFKKNWLMIVVDYTRKYTLPSQYIGDYNRIQ